ncbi:MAG: type III pantothenate kinase [Flavobacteriales bacterium]
MHNKTRAYLLDAGNTHVKLGEVQQDAISNIKRFEMKDFPWGELNGNIPLVVSSVLSEEWKKSLEDFFQTTIYIHAHMKLPFQLRYLSPETLGIDRLCNMAAISHWMPSKNQLVIDLGTCIKCDLLTSEGIYFGGSISPGIQMRAKALHQFTAKLPLLPINAQANLIGRNTQESIESGVFLGWKAEITAMIQNYLDIYPDLIVYITGGDARYFDFGQKSNIFVHEHLTLEGILEIYRLNEHSF